VRGVYAARTLAHRGVPVIGVAKRRSSYGSRTNACEDVLFGDVAGPALVELLVGLAESLPGSAVLVPCLDQSVLTLSEHRAFLEEHGFLIALPSADTVALLTDKAAFYPFASENGFRIPETHLLYEESDVRRVAAEVTFPCVLKPPLSKSPRWLAETHLKAFKAKTADELLRLYTRYAPFANPLIVQRWIPGSDRTLYSCNCYLDRNSEPQVVFVSRKLRQWPPQAGETCLGEECREDVVAEEAARLLKRVGFSGLAYVEFKRDEESGDYFIIEPNVGRPTARSGLAEGTGVELLYTMYCDLVGRPLPESRQQRYTGAKWLWLRRDLMSALYYWRKGELTPAEWLRSLRGPKVHALFSWRDPMPFLLDTLQAARLYASAEERKKRDLANPLGAIGEIIRQRSS
jgi:D-aspartate ligase